ncbi:MAG: tetratricopeptide repeat protein [bacterium]
MNIAYGILRRLSLVALLAGLFACKAGAEWETEVNLVDADGKRLDAFEIRRLNEADTSFRERRYREAVVQYEAFSKEFSRSIAVPYAILRKGRSMQNDLKRGEAIKIYNDLMDYFPDRVAYAAPALFYIGECQLDNGNREVALKTWKELADDKDYRKHPIAAYALNALAGRLLEQGEVENAAKYYLQIAVDFRDPNWDAAWRAMGELLRIHVAVRPNVKVLREACTTLKGFGRRPGEYRGAEEDYFWSVVSEQVGRYGHDNRTLDTEAKRKDFCGYWAGVMEGTQPTNDDFQIQAAGLRLAYNGKSDMWVKRLDEQFAAYQKPADYGRIVKWIGLYIGDKKKVEEYYSKLIFPKMQNSAIKALLFTVILQFPEMGKSTYFKLHFDAMDDKEKCDVGIRLFEFEFARELAVDMFHRMKDVDRARMEELRLWAKGGGKKEAEFGLPLADYCVLVPAYAKEAYWLKADLLRGIGKYREAIEAYMMSDDPPKNFYAIADCYVALGRTDAAVTQLREIEKFFVNEKSRASLKIADVYEGAGKRALCVAELRGVLEKYPKSGESSTAHQRLQAMGILTKGGVHAE